MCAGQLYAHLHLCLAMCQLQNFQDLEPADIHVPDQRAAVQAAKVPDRLQEALAVIPALPEQLQGLDFQADGLRVPQPPYPDLPDSAPSLPKAPYGLTAQDGSLWSPVLDSQWDSFTTWCIRPANLSRVSRPISKKTLSNVQCTISCFLGYVWRSLKLGGSMLTLAACLQPQLIVHFIRAKMQAAQQQQTVIKVHSHLLKVLKWWAHPAQQLSAAERSNLKQLEAWLNSIGKIILLTIQPKRKDREQLEEQNQWLGAGELVKAIDDARKDVMQECTDLLASGAEQFSTQLCRQVHDVALAVMLFGYLPPVRISCIVSLTTPEEACTLCDVAGCQGNRLTSDSQTGQLKGMVLTHHKTAAKLGRALCIPQLPEEVLQLLQLYLNHCRSRLALRFAPRTLFVKARGKPMTTEAMSEYFKAHVLPALDLNSVSFPPQRLRHIFVDERLSGGSQPTPGPAHGDAALLMGNSLQTWELRYHLDRDQARMNRLGEGMYVWRSYLLGQSAAVAQQGRRVSSLEELD